MKLVLTIMSKEDSQVVMSALTEEKIQVTKLATTGGFLRSGNTTLITGVEDSKVKKVIDIISRCSSKRTQIMPSAMPIDMGIMSALTFEVTVGGATIFVLDVIQYEKV
ncbi:MAG: cyclic-di-AMP receptor [Oscillospiraceae bacterium]|jgi:uncharacterized protein YaaQ|nr:cyclic-di-AMP receptor [Oscillospiraceae bacterium]